MSLNERQKTVNLILDEVYNSKRVEYSGGKFYGYENQQVTKTLLGFMIKSVAGKFHDMVALVPISKVDADVIDTLWHKVLKVIDANISIIVLYIAVPLHIRMRTVHTVKSFAAFITATFSNFEKRN